MERIIKVLETVGVFVWLMVLLFMVIVLEILTIWRYLLPENHWLRLKVEGTLDL